MEDMNAGIRPRNVNPNRNYREDGSVIYCEWYNSVLKDESGEVTSVLSLVLDVTEREKAQADAQRRAAELESFFSQMSEGVVLHDADGHGIMINAAAREILGVNPKGSAEERAAQFRSRGIDGIPLKPEDTL